MSLRRCVTAVLATVAAMVLTACGDAETADERSYTKAPLEELGVFIEPEHGTVMDRLGEPNLLGREPASDEDEDADAEG